MRSKSGMMANVHYWNVGQGIYADENIQKDIEKDLVKGLSVGVHTHSEDDICVPECHIRRPESIHSTATIDS
jgi:hypothetical protein